MLFCCFLDLDGTLVDSRQPILISLNHALESVGIDRTPVEELDELIGPPFNEQVPIFLERQNQPQTLLKRIISAFRAEYEYQCVELARLYPGVEETVTALAGSAALAIVTSKPLRFVVSKLGAVELREFFHVVEGDRSHPCRAPDENSAANHGTDCENRTSAKSVMIGDRTHDTSAGSALGMRTVRVTWGHGTEEELVGSGAEMLAHSPDELFRFLDGLTE